MQHTPLLTDSREDIARAAALLREGALVGIPTETVYGLAANAFDGQAVAGIFAAKGRPMDNPLIVHIADVSQWDALVAEIPDKARALAEAFWPGPLTVILPHSDRIPPQVSAGLSTVAVRLPAHPLARAIIAEAGCPLAAPSGNRSGSPSPTTAAHMLADMDGRIAAIVDGGDCAVGVESTVVSVLDGRVRLLRPGGVTLEMLRSVVGEVETDRAVTEQLAEGAVAASPGMKYKHYAPAARVTLVRGDAAATAAYMNGFAGQKGVYALCFDGEEQAVRLPSLTYGARDDAAAQARAVFAALRRFDDMKAERVLAACPSCEGMGLAVYNRLIRAAAFEVVDV